MRWNSKTDIIALLIAGGGLALVGLVVGIAAPIIANIKQGDFGAITIVVVLLILICCAIYLLRCRNRKNKKPKGQQEQ